MANLGPFIDFSVTLDNTGPVPVIQVRDTGSYPSGVDIDITGIASVTQPDGITVTGDWAIPDIEYLAGALSMAEHELRLASNSKFQKGLYVITYTVRHDGDDTTLTKNFALRYDSPVVKISESFDVFTPSLRINDVTKYAQATIASYSVGRAWVATMESLGTINSYDDVFDLLLNDEYYDASYAVTLVSTVNSILSGATWVTIKDKITGSGTFKTEVPLSLDALYTEITAYETALNDRCGCNSNYNRDDYVYAVSLFQNLLWRGNCGIKEPLRNLIDTIQKALNGGTDPTYIISNEVIQPYSFKDFCGCGCGESNTKEGVIEIRIGTGNNYRLSSDGRQLTPLNSNGKPSLINKKMALLFMGGLKVPALANSGEAYYYFNPATGTITLTNGTFSDQTMISITTNANVDTDIITDQGAYDTELTFSASTENYAYGILGTADALSSKLKFRFNKILVTSGLNARLSLKMGAASMLALDIPSDYVGNSFEVDDIYGITHTGIIMQANISY